MVNGQCAFGDIIRPESLLIRAMSLTEMAAPVTNRAEGLVVCFVNS